MTYKGTNLYKNYIYYLMRYKKLTKKFVENYFEK